MLIKVFHVVMLLWVSFVQAVSKHVAMIKELKGMPGLDAARWAEAFTVCLFVDISVVV
jgi:hypothetical protein